MKRPLFLVAPYLLGMAVLMAACAPDPLPSLVVEPVVTVLEVLPSALDLTVGNEGVARQVFVASAHFDDGTTTDVTSEMTWSIDDPRLGGFQGALFVAGGAAGGRGVIRAKWNDVVVSVPVSVKIQRFRTADGAPANAPSLFLAATEDPTRAPTIVYPVTGTIVPPNLGDFEVHWTDGSGNDLYELSLRSEYLDLRVYQRGIGGGTFASFSEDEWRIASTLQGGSFHVSVRGLSSGAPAIAGSSVPVSLGMTEQPIHGGLYYWASTVAGGAYGGIFRHDFDKPGEPAEPFMTSLGGLPSGHNCVACHALSRDGTKMAVTFDGGNGEAGVVDVASRTVRTPVDGSMLWNFATFDPTAKWLLTVYRRRMTLRDAETGVDLATVPTLDAHPTHPDWSPLGNAIVYSTSDEGSDDWTFRRGRLVLQTIDAASTTFGPATELAAAAGGHSYYPSFSPDGKWILFNRSEEDSYNASTAQVWVAPVDGSLPAFPLTAANQGPGLANSWPRWAPFQQSIISQTGDQEPLFWFTVASQRAFGVRLGAGRPQIWMAPFFPSRARSGQEASAPAFRLPFQAMDSNNHIAQWTEQVVAVE